MGACAGINGCCGHDARYGEYEFAEINTDPNSHLTLTSNQANNTALMKYIRSFARKIALSLANEFPRKPLDQIDTVGSLLRLKVLNGHLLSGSELTITPTGFETGFRKKKDGITYFGCKKRTCNNGDRIRHGDIVNDVVVKLREKSIRELYRGRHFKISYKSNSYWIQDLGIGFGTFMKIDVPLVIQDGSIIMFGDSFLVLNLTPERNMGKVQDGSSKLKVTVYAGPANGGIL